MSLQLFKKLLTTSYVASSPIAIDSDDLTLFFDLTLSGGPTTVDFYLEYTDDDPTDSATTWRQEVDEVDVAGAVTHNIVTRTFGALADGTYNLALQFTRRAPYARLQIKGSVGGGLAIVTAPFGSKPQAPQT